MYDQLHQHGIVVGRNLIIVVNVRVHTNSVSSRDVDVCNLARTRHKILRRILCIDTALDRMALDMDVILRHT